MKVSIIVASVAQVASAHYFFNTNIINGVTTSANKYIMASTRATAYNPIKFSSNPAADIRDGSYIDGPDIRCNQGAFTNSGKTEVMTVAAGSEIRFKLAVQATMQHPGPGLMYMSRATNDDVKSYDGSGDWFKIFQEGVCDTNADFTTDAWCTWDRDWIAATIPKDTPSGEYLVRVEHIGIHKSFHNQPEHYTSCAQVKVTDGGSGSPGPLVKFPGAYKDTDEYANFSIYNGYKTFPFPGPAVWNGTSSSTPVAASEPVNSSTSSKPVATSSAAAAPVKPSTTFQVVTKTSSKAATPTAEADDDSCSD